jgi:DNA polymerase III epsilon subunit-like protein
VTDVDNWPRLVQLAFLSFDSDGNQLFSADYIIKPEGFLIPQSATQIHGISTERATLEGEPLRDVLRLFQERVAEAEVLVAHNISFDEKIVGSELIRAGMPNSIPSKRKICTMESTTEFCAIKGPYGNKWPKLSELYFKLFGTEFNEMHNAAGDIQATATCFWELKRRGVIP